MSGLIAVPIRFGGDIGNTGAEFDLLPNGDQNAVAVAHVADLYDARTPPFTTEIYEVQLRGLTGTDASALTGKVYVNGTALSKTLSANNTAPDAQVQFEQGEAILEPGDLLKFSVTLAGAVTDGAHLEATIWIGPPRSRAQRSTML